MDLLAQTAAAGDLVLVLTGLWASGWALARPSRKGLALLQPLPRSER